MIKTEIEWFSLQEKMPNKSDGPFIGVLLKLDNGATISCFFLISRKVFLDIEGCLLKNENIAYWAYFPEGPPLESKCHPVGKVR